MGATTAPSPGSFPAPLDRRQLLPPAPPVPPPRPAGRLQRRDAAGARPSWPSLGCQQTLSNSGPWRPRPRRTSQGLSSSLVLSLEPGRRCSREPLKATATCARSHGWRDGHSGERVGDRQAAGSEIQLCGTGGAARTQKVRN